MAKAKKETNVTLSREQRHMDGFSYANTYGEKSSHILNLLYDSGKQCYQLTCAYPCITLMHDKAVPPDDFAEILQDTHGRQHNKQAGHDYERYMGDVLDKQPGLEGFNSKFYKQALIFDFFVDPKQQYQTAEAVISTGNAKIIQQYRFDDINRQMATKRVDLTHKYFHDIVAAQIVPGNKKENTAHPVQSLIQKLGGMAGKTACAAALHHGVEGFFAVNGRDMGLNNGKEDKLFFFNAKHVQHSAVDQGCWSMPINGSKTDAAALNQGQLHYFILTGENFLDSAITGAMAPVFQKRYNTGLRLTGKI